VSVLKGSFVFAADLIRALSPRRRQTGRWISSPLSSYGTGTQTSGKRGASCAISSTMCAERDVLLVDDILEIRASNPVLCQEPDQGARRATASGSAHCSTSRTSAAPPLVADFTGFEAGDEFLVGYGLDWGAPLPRPALYRRGGENCSRVIIFRPMDALNEGVAHGVGTGKADRPLFGLRAGELARAMNCWCGTPRRTDRARSC